MTAPELRATTLGSNMATSRSDRYDCATNQEAAQSWPRNLTRWVILDN